MVIAFLKWGIQSYTSCILIYSKYKLEMLEDDHNGKPYYSI